jgi:hypothetical protein
MLNSRTLETLWTEAHSSSLNFFFKHQTVQLEALRVIAKALLDQIEKFYDKDLSESRSRYGQPSSPHQDV